MKGEELFHKKKELRKHIALLKKQYADVAIRQQLSAAILTVLESHPVFKAADTVLLYHSLGDEVDTHAFIRKWSGTKRILLPVIVGDELELRAYTDSDHLATSASYGILEPMGDAFTDYDSIGFIAIPGVAFDARGNRLGRGKGYYDRLLPQMPSAYKAGICFPFQLVDEVPAEDFDVRMDTIITINENELSHTYHSLPACDGE